MIIAWLRCVCLSATLITFTVSARAELSIGAYYRAEVLTNTSGGIDQGSAYLDDGGVTVSADVDALFGSADASVFGYLLWNNSNQFSGRYVGDLQGISNIDAAKALRIYELWYEQALSDRVALRFGLYDLNSEFDAIDTAGLFINSSHGIGAEYGQSGLAGPSIFPVTALAARFDWQIADASRFRYAVLDGVPGDPDDPAKTTIELGDGDGALHALEFNHVFTNGLRLGIGGWLYSEEFEVLDGGAAARFDDGNAGLYGFADASLLSVSERGPGLNVYLRYGIANDDFNVLDSYIGAGAVATGMLLSRPDDQLGIALGIAKAGDAYRRAQAASGFSTDSHETNVELTYRAAISEWLQIQPTIQYVINPGVDPDLDNALIIGLRFEFSVSLGD